MAEGIVFDIKEFSVYDGPGIRQTVFLKGCPLRCSWCHNPEGLTAAPQIMVSRSACTDCGKCREVCSGGTCSLCGRCVAVCPNQARRIAGERMSAQALAQMIMRDAAYYAACGGGVTFSGGEPLMQHRFVVETVGLLDDVHCAIETSGYADPEVFERVISRMQFVMMDIKLMDDAMHRAHTGVSNERILTNARTLLHSGLPCRIRVPLIPGVSDTQENLRATAEFVARHRAGAKVELLPYHKTAGAKYEMIGMRYAPRFDPERQVQTRKDIFKAYGLECDVL
ncbi:MAG: glycyl-radical enzyme activating protein [Clostridia bacterium]|nr:glycyl-radical enzyme activating protein [Clostridia bacterium]